MSDLQPVLFGDEWAYYDSVAAMHQPGARCSRCGERLAGRWTHRAGGSCAGGSDGRMRLYALCDECRSIRWRPDWRGPR